MRDAVIVSAVRSAVGKGKRDGALAGVHATEVSARVMRAALEHAKLDPATVDITGRILEMLATYGYDKNHKAV